MYYIGLGGFGCRFSNHASNAGLEVVLCAGSRGDLLRVSEGEKIEVASGIGFSRDWRKASEELQEQAETIRETLEEVGAEEPTVLAFGLGGAVGYALAQQILKEPPVPLIVLTTVPGESEDPQVRRNAAEQVKSILGVSIKLPVLWVDNALGGYERVNRVLERTLLDLRDFLGVPVEELPNLAGNYALSPSISGEKVTGDVVKTSADEVRRLVKSREPEEHVVRRERRGPDPESLRELF
ncbi:hypothetical protein [Methanopyrus sp.]